MVVLDACVEQFIDTHCSEHQSNCDLCRHLEYIVEGAEESSRPITSVPEMLFATAWMHCAYEEFAYSIMPQTTIGRYYADFTVSGMDYFVNHSFFTTEQLQVISSKLPHYAIEIDGFAWHDRTPEQAEYERIRERDLQAHGYTVLRFAAREVLRDPIPCVMEVSKRILGDVQKIYRSAVLLP